MSTKGVVAAVWKHFDAVLVENSNGTMEKIGYKCKLCETKVMLHPKEGYRHLKKCEKMTNEGKEATIANLPSEEVEKYSQYWVPGISCCRSLNCVSFS
jgi:hypothetical protein